MTALARTPGSSSASPLPGDDQASSLRRLVDALSGAPLVGRDEADRERARGAEGTRPAAGERTARIVAIASGKGGVGKTSIAVNLSVALCRLGARVTLLDGDLGLANADVLCGVTPRGDLADVVCGRREVSEIALRAPGGFTLIPGAAGVTSLADLGAEGARRLLDAIDHLATSADAIIIDCGAGIGRGVLSLFGAADLGLVVTTPEPTSVTDAYALLKCANRGGAAGGAPGGAPGRAPGGGMPLSRMRLVVNQARDRHEVEAVHERIASVTARFLGERIRLGGWVWTDASVGRAVRARQPLMVSHAQCRAASCITDVARSVREEIGVSTESVAGANARRGVVTSWAARLLGVAPAR